MGAGGAAEFLRPDGSIRAVNRHFVQDIGAFQIGVGAALVAARFLPDGLVVGLMGGVTGSAAHTVSHLVGTDLGGTPVVDIPTFSVITVLLAVAT